MRTRLTNREELKRIFTETLLNKSSKLTKISDNSVLSAVGYGVASVGSRALKDIALVESGVFPDLAVGSELDNIARNYGVAPRFAASPSSTTVRLIGSQGTFYEAGVNSFSSTSGISFSLQNNVTIGASGFAYASVISDQIGENSNVQSGNINNVNPIPSGHRGVVNEYSAFGGRDNESDDLFRKRIKEGANQLSRGTLSYIEQAFNKINNNVLRVFYQGNNEQGQTVLAVTTQNGTDLNTSQLDELLSSGEEFFSLTDLRPAGGQTYGLVLKNIEYQPVDISFRVDLLDDFNVDDIRTNIQIGIQKLLDYRVWRPGIDKFEWDDALQVVKSTRGVRYVPDQFFFPNRDVQIDKNKLPRVRGFLMLDRDGVVISDLSGNLSPSFYPLRADFSFQQTVLSGLEVL